MKAITLIFAALLLAGCTRVASGPREQAIQAVQRQLTNDVIGYSRTIEITPEPNPTNGATAVVEFVNASGGIERTNLPYYFFAGADGQIEARLNHTRMLQRGYEAFWQSQSNRVAN